jgi:hypothetical protein
MEQNHQHFSLSFKEHAIINHFTNILKETLIVQQEILAQLTLLNNRVLTMEHRVGEFTRGSNAKNI